MAKSKAEYLFFRAAALEHHWRIQGQRRAKAGLKMEPSVAPPAFREDYVRGYMDEVLKHRTCLIQRVRRWLWGLR